MLITLEGGRDADVKTAERNGSATNDRRTGHDSVLITLEGGRDAEARPTMDATGSPAHMPLVNHPKDDARQSQKSIPRIYREIDITSRFPLLLT